jgi:3-carboxy-cis,cis-muconate cycloisomerase
VPLALEAMIHSHEVDGARSAMMDEAIEQSCILSGNALLRLESVLAGLRVHPDQMRQNLDLSGGLITTEAVMMTLARSVGRQDAPEVVHPAASIAADTGQPFSEVLAATPTVAQVPRPDTDRAASGSLRPHRLERGHRASNQCAPAA